MFRHHCVVLRELAFITLPNYISTIAALDLQLYLRTYVIWQGNEGKLPDDDTVVSKHVGA